MPYELEPRDAAQRNYRSRLRAARRAIAGSGSNMIAMIVPLPWSRSIERLSGALAGSGTGIAFVDVRSSFTP